MTVPFPTQQNPAKGGADAGNARKRRRRTAAGGAADDCFTCTKRGVKCDRRRPYCSQCLEVGNECSGYKTQLTWGVGVASRGKLRGLSLPVAKAPPVPAVIGHTKKPSTGRSRASSTATAASIAHWTERGSISPRMISEETAPSLRSHHHPSASMPTTPFHSFDLSQLAQQQQPQQQPQHHHHHHHHHHQPQQPQHHHHSDMITAMPQAPAWNPISYHASMPSENPRFQKMAPHMVSIPPPEHGLSSSIDTLSDVDYMSPLSHSFSRDEVPFMHSPNILYDGFPSHPHHQTSPIPTSPGSAIIMDHQRAGVPTSYPGLGYPPSEPSSSSLHSSVDIERHMSHKMLQDCEPLGEIGSWPRMML